MNKKEYLKEIIDDANYILNKYQGSYIVNPLSGQRILNVSKYDYEKWITKTNKFLKKYNYTDCQVNINGNVPYSEVVLTKLAMITALYESFELDDDCINNLNFLSEDIKKLYKDEHYSQSVFDAFKFIEVQVKNKSGLKDLFGVSLMRQAFSKQDGPLKNINLPDGEQVAQMELFAGAIGFIKNPKSHNMISVSKEKATELLHLANYLLRILQENNL
ncbi:MAG: TIGR02391 family protein [Candidatus Gastranaerophilales bacterium]|nr:TIGR02391 family protein [Candidatus Gastranaerophilales bacterium]